MKNIIAVFILSFISSCTSQNENPVSFVRRIKDKDLSVFNNVSIEARGKSDNELHYYYSHTILKGDTLTIPSFEYFDDFYKKDSATYNNTFKKLCEHKEIKGSLCLNYAKEYVKKLDKAYKEIGVIGIISNPNRGSFVEFILDKKCSVYYLEDATSLTSYWKDKFKNLKKIDSKWYYNCD